MVLGKSRERPAPVTQETQGDPGSFAQRPPGAADVLQHEGGGWPGPPQVVAVVRVALGPQVIAEPLGLLIGIGVAAHPRQQSRVVQDAALRLVQTQVIGHPQREQASPHHVLHRLTQTKVRTQRQQSDQLGKTQVTTLPRCHMPTVPAAALAPDGSAEDCPENGVSVPRRAGYMACPVGPGIGDRLVWVLSSPLWWHGGSSMPLRPDRPRFEGTAAA